MGAGEAAGDQWGIAIQNGDLISYNSDGTSTDEWNMGPFDDSLAGRHHIAVSDDGTKRRFFVDGNMRGMYTNKVSNTMKPVSLRIGAIGGNYTVLPPSAPATITPVASNMTTSNASNSLQNTTASFLETSLFLTNVSGGVNNTQASDTEIISATTPPPPINPPAPQLATAGCGFKGSIAGVRVWSRALNFAEIQRLMHSTATNIADGLLGEWRLDEGDKVPISTVAQDRSLQQVQGTFIGASAPQWESPVPSPSPPPPSVTPAAEFASNTSASNTSSSFLDLSAEPSLPFLDIVKYKCKCSKGYTGWDCSKHVCNFHGMVTTPDEGSSDMGCMCFPGYSGSNCAAAENSTCLNGGQMSGGTCHCPSDYAGERCQHHICNGYGNVTGDKHDRCKCAAGRAGKDCSICITKTAPLAPGKTLADRANIVYVGSDLAGCSKHFCNYHGVPNGGVCKCDDNYEGVDCLKHRCNGNGRVVNGRCSCNTDWSGERCSQHVCNKHGVLRNGACRCETGWKGAHCRTPVCSGHGRMINVTDPLDGTNTSKCECEEPFSGPECKEHACNNKGVWLEASGGRCLCEDEYMGDRCDAHVCSHHGSFLNGRCACDFGWIGSDCADADMSPERLALEQSNPVSKRVCSCRMVVNHPQFKVGFGFVDGLVSPTSRSKWDSFIKGVGFVSTPIEVKTQNGPIEAGEESEKEAEADAAIPPTCVLNFQGEPSQTVIASDLADLLGVDAARVAVVKAEMSGSKMKASIAVAEVRGEPPVSELKTKMAEMFANGKLVVAGQSVQGFETPPPPQNLAGIHSLHTELSARMNKVQHKHLPDLHRRLDVVATGQSSLADAGTTEQDQIMALQSQISSLEKSLGLPSSSPSSMGGMSAEMLAAMNAFGADGTMKPGFKFDASGMIGPDGKPLGPGFGPDGKPLPGFGPDGKPLPGLGPDGKPLLGPDGKPMKGPDGKPLAAAFNNGKAVNKVKPHPTAGSSGVVTRMREVIAGRVSVGDGSMMFGGNSISASKSKRVKRVAVVVEVPYQWALLHRMDFISALRKDIGAALKINKERAAIASSFTQQGTGVAIAFSITGFSRTVRTSDFALLPALSKMAGVSASLTVTRTQDKEVALLPRDQYLEADTLQFSGFTQLGVGADPVAMKVLSVPMPGAGQDAHVVPHGLRSLSQVQWMDVHVMSKSGRLILDVASPSAVCNCSQDREVLYHWWMDNHNINVLQTNNEPGSAIDGATVKITILHTRPECCKQCKAGKPCGDSCISKDMTCSKPEGVGCACAA